MKDQKLLTTAEVCETFGISRRTVTTWRKKGLKAYKQENTGSGKAPNLFRLQEVQSFAVTHGRSGLDLIGRRKKRPPPDPVPDPPAPAPAADPGPSEPPAPARTPSPGVPVGPRPKLDKLPPDTLITMAKNLETAERITFGAWAKAQREMQLAAKEVPPDEPPFTTAELSVLQRAWHDNVLKRKLLERELPRILLAKGRYVDVNEMSRVFTSAVASMSAELDQVGMSVAGLCVGKTARQIRDLVDEAIRRTRAHIEDVWSQLSAEE